MGIGGDRLVVDHQDADLLADLDVDLAHGATLSTTRGSRTVNAATLGCSHRRFLLGFISALVGRPERGSAAPDQRYESDSLLSGSFACQTCTARRGHRVAYACAPSGWADGGCHGLVHAPR